MPREEELSLGVAGLTDFARKHGLPYLAANLESTAGGPPPFPRFALFEREGLTIAVIGLVDRDQIARLPAAVRSQWKVERPSLALYRVRDALEAQLRRRPDLIVALWATDGENHARILGGTRVDVALGLFNQFSLINTHQVVEVLPENGGREHARNQPVLLGVTTSDLGVGRVEALFEGGRTDTTPPTPPALRRLTHDVRTVWEGGPTDPAVDLAWRTLEESLVPDGARLLLPDVAETLRTHPELASLVWGDHILHRAGYRDYASQYPGRFSDPLWMRFVTNLMRERTGAEVALSRNLPREFDTVGPVTKDVFDAWMRAPDAVQMVHLSGADLLRLTERLVRQRDDAQVPATSVIVASGLDPDRQIVGGRPIDPAEMYRVAVTDAVADMGDLSAMFAPLARETRFVSTASGYTPADDGRELRVSEVVTSALAGWAKAGGADFDPARQADFEASLADTADQLTGRWLLRLDEVSLQAARYRNTDNVGTFAASRETRATTPDNFSLGLGVNTALLYDGPAIAWESRVQGKLQRAVIDLPGQNIPPQEQADDLVGSTELRLNAVRLEVGAGKVPIVPFVQAALDTEFTATPDPEATAENPDATLPHQLIARTSVGVVSRPGPRLREIRVGALAQRDFSEATAHDDFGALAGYQFQLAAVRAPDLGERARRALHRARRRRPRDGPGPGPDDHAEAPRAARRGRLRLRHGRRVAGPRQGRGQPRAGRELHPRRRTAVGAHLQAVSAVSGERATLFVALTGATGPTDVVRRVESAPSLPDDADCGLTYDLCAVGSFCDDARCRPIDPVEDVAAALVLVARAVEEDRGGSPLCLSHGCTSDVEVCSGPGGAVTATLAAGAPIAVLAMDVLGSPVDLVVGGAALPRMRA